MTLQAPLNSKHEFYITQNFNFTQTVALGCPPISTFKSRRILLADDVIYALMKSLFFVVCSFTKSETHRFEVPRMLFDTEDVLENYIRDNQDK